jgi:hypothetical protein
MNSLLAKPHFYEIEPLFASERDLPLEPDETRNRVVRRARTALPRSLRFTPAVRAALPRGARFGEIAAITVLLSGLSLAAFFAGYRAKGRIAPASAMMHAVAPAGAAPSAVALPSVTAADVNLETTPIDSRGRRSKVEVSAKAIPEIAAYISEVRVLQPARQALADKKYESALTAIAEHQRRFGAGKLAEEREALRVKSLLGLGRVAEAQRAASALGECFPNSALVEPVNELLRTQR